MPNVTADQALQLAMQYHASGRIAEAIAIFEAIARASPSNAAAHYNLGKALHEAGRLEQAVGEYQTAIQIWPDHAEAMNNLGNALAGMDRADEALAAYRAAIRVRPDYAEAHSNLAGLLHHQGQLDQSLDAYRAAMRADAGLAEAYTGMGVLFQDRGDLPSAIEAFGAAVRLRPDASLLHWNFSLALLAAGDYDRGWAEFEWREKALPQMRRDFEQPRWEGSDLAVKTILLYAQGGFGDTIQFIRYAPLVAARGGRVIVECQQELCELVAAVDGVERVTAAGEALPEFDVQCPLMSLAGVFGTRVESVPATVPYLRLDANRMEKWRARIAEHTSRSVQSSLAPRRDPSLSLRRTNIEVNQPRLSKVGLVWSGSANPRDPRSRSLDVFAPLANVPGIKFYSLQKGPEAMQAKSPPTGLKLIDFGEELKDFSDAAAIIAQLDLVISVDTAAAHLAGALGKPVWTLIATRGDFRWLHGRDDSPWYPTMRLFRQAPGEKWEDVGKRVGRELSKMMKK